MLFYVVRQNNKHSPLHPVHISTQVKTERIKFKTKQKLYMQRFDSPQNKLNININVKLVLNNLLVLNHIFHALYKLKKFFKYPTIYLISNISLT